MTVTVTKPAFNLRDTLNSLKKKTGLFGEQVLRSDTAADYYNVVGRNKNLLINGDFRVWQRGTTFTGVTGYTADRFTGTAYSGATFNAARVAGTGEFMYGLRISGISTGQIEFEQRIEGINLPDTGKLTLSFWARGSKQGSARTGRLINGNTGAQNQGQTTVTINTSWTYYSITIDALAATEAQYYRLFVLDNLLAYFDSSAVWLDITGVQLEVGSVATPFEFRSLGYEQSLCKRYYYYVGGTYGETPFLGAATSSTTGQTTFTYPVEMRAAPTITKTGSWTWLNTAWNSSLIWTGMTSSFVNTKNAVLSATVSSGLTAGQVLGCQCDSVATSRIIFDAEFV